MKDYTIFIVEDEPWYGEILMYYLGLNPDYSIKRFETGRACLAHMHEKPDLVTIDYSLPDMQGDALFDKIRDVNPSQPVIFISAQEDIAVAVDLLKKGVNDYLVKDDATKELLWKSITRIRETESLKQEVQELKAELGQKFSFQKTIIGQSDKLKAVFKLIDKASKTKINVSISGETGTGKEVVAKAIHYNSDRKKKKFVAVNMGAIPKDLIESELFGHEKGAFTGATHQKPGKFEEANGGTIFLDEIAELELNLQSKLLRILQEREVVRVGGNTPLKLDVRLIVATHKNLEDQVKEGKFRKDLYFRIMGLPVLLPPLRERDKDALLLARHFVDEFARENNMGKMKFDNDAKKKLMQYHFPGNIRELKAVVELAAVMCENNEIGADDITFTTLNNDEFLIKQHKTLKHHTRDIIKYYLGKNNSDVIATAKDLDIGKSTIYKMIQNRELEFEPQS
ncbi:MAG: sigma-54 dependent transcriptional regulator [Bacteroidia bacterium]|nr:sigma-54 dependent transcriptional regulator [Bacteroidia bacterium]